jgi:DnaK suppressor protein
MSAMRDRHTDEEIQTLRDGLTRELEKLERSLKTTRRAARPVRLDQTSVGRLSRIDAIQNQSFSQGMQDRQQIRAALLEEAFKRLEDGSYGLCQACGGTIQFQRLMLFPETQTCSTCAA